MLHQTQTNLRNIMNIQNKAAGIPQSANFQVIRSPGWVVYGEFASRNEAEAFMETCPHDEGGSVFIHEVPDMVPVSAFPTSEDQDECEDGVGQFLAVPKDLWGKLCCLAEGVAWSAEGASSFIREARGVCGEIDSFYGKPAPSGEVVGK
jgi:hypothetical protein